MNNTCICDNCSHVEVCSGGPTKVRALAEKMLKVVGPSEIGWLEVSISCPYYSSSYRSATECEKIYTG